MSCGTTSTVPGWRWIPAAVVALTLAVTVVLAACAAPPRPAARLAAAVDPGPAAAQCGHTGPLFASRICSSYYTALFWGLP